LELEIKRSELEKRKKKRTIRNTGNFTESLPAKLNLNGEQRSCYELSGAADDKAHSFVYWLAAGREVADIYKKEEDKRLSADRSYGSLMQYYEKVGQGLSMNIAPSKREYIEYAIVDTPNKALFRAGEAYTSYNNLGMIHTYYDFNRDTTIYLATSDLHVCFCNHNKHIPVDVNFRFQTFGDYD